MYSIVITNKKKYRKVNATLDKLVIFDKKQNIVMELFALQDKDKRLANGVYKLDVTLDMTANKALGRYNDRFIKSDLYQVVSITGQNKLFKVGNTADECGDDILLGISENGLGRINESITANEKFLDFILKVGSKNIELIVK